MTPKRFGPTALTATLTTNIHQGGGGVAQLYDVIKRIHVANKTGLDATFSLWLGASNGNAAGTEIAVAVTVKANSYVDLYMSMPMASTEYLVGGASAGSALTMTIDAEQGVV